ncbi:MAG TPA: hypothetical protein VFS50_13520 [Meiothermus sp.]|jgi:hypothetical protein|nr:hypothetical protein [Meiothermus sp.]
MVSVDELRATGERMEKRLNGLELPRIQTLRAPYAELAPRFGRDLADERDQPLSKAGALMLVQQVWKAE